MLGADPAWSRCCWRVYFQEVVGLDPDAAMLDEAARAAEEQHINNVSWVRMRAEDLPGDLGRFRVITFAQSFH